MATKNFKIQNLLALVDRGKYEITDAAFAAVDRYDRIQVSKKMQHRKVAVQVMDLLAKEEIKYYYKDELPSLSGHELEADAHARLKAMPEGEAAPAVEAATEAPEADDSSEEE